MPSTNHRGGYENTKLTRAVLDYYGPECWLQLPGCTKRATTKDHVIPVDHGGDDSMENLRPACNNCNGKRQNLAISGTTGGITVVVVLGPPAAGKSSYVREHAKKDDIIIDLDRIASAFMSGDVTDVHGYPPHIRNVAIGARKAAMSRALRTRYPCTVWLIHAVPTREQLQQYARLRYRLVTIDPGRAEVEARVNKVRPRDSHRGVARWYHRYPNGAESVELLAAHRTVSSVTRAEAATTTTTPSRPW